MKQFKYKAFISYSHKDMEYAERLQKSLESYIIPTRFRKEEKIRNKHFKIFRDATDLNSGSLEGNLDSELDDSEFLIVICSPNSAKASSNKHWVNIEVQHFIDIGREDYIIPVIIEGEPLSHNENECFCDALQKKTNGDEFLGIEARGVTKKVSFFHKLNRLLGIPKDDDIYERSFIHIVSRLLNIRFDDIWQRRKKAQRKQFVSKIGIALLIILSLFMAAKSQILFISALIAGLVALACGISVYYWRTLKKITYKYFVTYVDKWGLPEGITELSEEEVKKRFHHFRFEYQGGKLISVVSADSYGRPVEDSVSLLTFHPVIQKFEYDNKDQLILTRTYDVNGKNLFNYEHRPDLKYCRVNITKILNTTTDSKQILEVISGQENSLFQKREIEEEITSYSYERDDNGFITRQWFHLNHNEYKKTQDKWGVFEIKYENLQNGLIRQQQYFDRFEELMEDIGGIHTVSYKYDKSFNVIEKKFNGQIRYSSKYNAQGNRFYLLNGTEKIYDEFDSKGMVVAENYETREWANQADKKYEYDEKGRLITEYFYSNREPVMITKGFSAIHYEYENEQKTVEYYTDTENNRVNCTDGYCLIKRKYDQKGNVTVLSYFDKENKPVSVDGKHKIDTIFDLRNRPVKEIYYDNDGNVLGSVSYKYDERGLVTELIHYDAEGKIEQYYEGWIYKAKYDDLGNLMELARYDADENPCNAVVEGHIQRYYYDLDGYLKKLSYIDENGKPYCSPGWGYATLKIEHNSEENWFDESHFDGNNEPVISEEGIYKTRTFIKNGIPEKVEYYDYEGNLLSVESTDSENEESYIEDSDDEFAFTEDDFIDDFESDSDSDSDNGIEF